MHWRLVLAIVFSWITMAWAAAPDPVEMLQHTSDQMLAALNANKANLKNDPQLVYSIVDKILLPHVDLTRMAKRALGRNAWMQATPNQQARFTKEFTKLLVRTYSAALATYSNQTVKFFPIRGGIEAIKQIEIQSQINQADGPPIAVNYNLELINGQWKVYDFSVSGVSIINSFNSQFANELTQGDLERLIKHMTKHNSLKQSS